VELRNCSLDAHTLPVGIELDGNAPSVIRLLSNTVRLEDPEGIAFCLYASELRKHGPARIWLEGNTVQAGQPAMFTVRPGGVQVEAHGDALTVRRAGLGFVGFPRPAGWWQSSTWKGEQHRYESPANWIEINSMSAAVRDLER
jgi:hypothetical protein